MDKPLLEVRNLKTYFYTPLGVVKAVDDVSFRLGRGETLGLVGESGCGKSVSALSILRLVREPPGDICGGEVWFDGRNLLTTADEELRKIRGKEISMIFQEPMSSLNPSFTIGDQVSTVIRTHLGAPKKEALERSVEMLAQMSIPSPEKRIREYPHQLSGGMLQRVMIAMALACNPKLLIADEPTTALDVTVQAQIMDLLGHLQETYHTSIIFISHNFGLIAENTQNVAVMYAGKIIEYADNKTLFQNPLHPYTIGLLKSIPKVDRTQEQKRLYMIPGMVPELTNIADTCRFQPRCERAEERCLTEIPELVEVEPGHLVRCLLAC